MRILITGGSGYIGSAIIPQLVARGDDVHALARSDESADVVSGLDAIPVRGELTDADVLRDAAAAADAVIHVGSTGDERAGDVDRAAAAALQDGLGDRGTFVHTGGIWSWGDREGEVDETTPYDPPAMTAWRGDVEREVLGRGHAVIVSPAVVYGRGGGLLPLVFGPGDDGRPRYIGDGEQHCTLVHVEDIARLFVLALDAPAGSLFAGVAEHVPSRQIAAAFGDAETETLQEAEQRLGPLAGAMALDQRITAARTRARLDWTPEHTDALAELGAG